MKPVMASLKTEFGDMVKVSELKVGALIFPNVDPGQPVELTIKTIAGVPARIFRWAP